MHSKITLNVLVSSFRFIWIPMLLVYDRYKYFNSFSAGINFIRQNLTSTDVRFWRIKTIPALKGLNQTNFTVLDKVDRISDCFFSLDHSCLIFYYLVPSFHLSSSPGCHFTILQREMLYFSGTPDQIPATGWRGATWHTTWHNRVCPELKKSGLNPDRPEAGGIKMFVTVPSAGE